MSGSNRWARIGVLFERALGLPVGERQGFLERSCPDDPDLAAEVGRMLAAHEREGGPLDRPPAGRDALASVARRAVDEARGEPALVGFRAGPYKVVRELGRGGMGVVYEAWDERLRRPLALKILPPSLRADAEARARFLDEARAASALEHPAICTVYDLGETEDARQFIAMAYYRGRTVEDLLRDGPVPVGDALDWALQVAGGLERAHDAGIIHRDIKPSNLLVTDEGRVKILDFGVAKLEGAATATLPGAPVGTPAYMAPEQARGEAVDRRADLFSFGAVLYELLSGRRAFAGDTVQETLRAIRFDDPPALVALRPDLPAALGRIVERCLAKDRDQRYAAAGDLARDLSTVQSGAEPERGLWPARPVRPVQPARPEPAEASLPGSLTRFIGREREVRRVLAELATTRLLTLTGPGGTGKTRLALEATSAVADDYPDGVRFVSLAALRDPAAVPAALAVGLGVAETPTRTALEVLQQVFGAKRCLIVLDNFEQVVEAAPVLAELLARCPGLELLVTSRILLRVRGERVFSVPPLELPEEASATTVADLERAPATALFLDRARSARSDFEVTDREAPAIAEICRRLDGLPLAIELAAARVRHFSPESLLSRLGRRLDVLGGGPRDTPQRHQTLRRAVLWSYELLDPGERSLFRRLGVFAEGFTLKMAEAMLREEATARTASGGERGDLPPGDLLDPLTALLDHSLVQRQAPRSGTPAGNADRYAMLDTLRELAFERLEKEGERGWVVGAHAATFLALAEAAAEHLTGPEQARWIERLVAEQGNLRVALDRAEQDGRVGTALRLGAALWRFWLVRGDLRQGTSRLERLVELAGDGADEPARLAAVLQGLGTFLSNLGENERAVTHLERSLEIHRELGDLRGLASQLNNLGWVAAEITDLARARELSEEALRLHQELGDVRGQAVAFNNLGWEAIYGGDFARAREAQARSLELRRRAGDRRGEAFALSNLAWAVLSSGDLDEADELLGQAEEIFDELDDRLIPGWTLVIRAMVAGRRGEHGLVVGLLRDAIPYWTEPGNISGGSVCFTLLARSLAALADSPTAGERAEPVDVEEARRVAEKAEELGRRVGSPWLVGYGLLARAEVALAAGELSAAESLVREARATFEAFGGRPGVTECEELLAAVERRR